jgi:hypothetical protein
MTEFDQVARHRANYLLQQGVWRATCRVCGHRVDHPVRRQAASLFRNHIRDTSISLIDLRSTHVGRNDVEILPGS